MAVAVGRGQSMILSLLRHTGTAENASSGALRRSDSCGPPPAQFWARARGKWASVSPHFLNSSAATYQWSPGKCQSSLFKLVGSDVPVVTITFHFQDAQARPKTPPLAQFPAQTLAACCPPNFDPQEYFLEQKQTKETKSPDCESGFVAFCSHSCQRTSKS